jgi:hypothetical protein
MALPNNFQATAEVILLYYTDRVTSIPFSLFFFFLALQPSAGYGLLVHEFLDHTQRLAAVGRTPLDE